MTEVRAHASSSLSAAEAAGGGSSRASPSVGITLCSVALQIARSACLECQLLLLLLSLLLHMGQVGEEELASDAAEQIRSDLIPALVSQLKTCALALWLCRTPAAARAPVGFDAQRLQQGIGPLPDLQMPNTPSGSSPAGAGRSPRGGGGGGAFGHPPKRIVPWGTSGGDADRNKRQAVAAAAAPAPVVLPLAVHLLQLFWQRDVGGAEAVAQGELAKAGQQLLEFLLQGLTTEAAAAEGSGGEEEESASSRLADKAVRIGYELFCAREFVALGFMVKLVAGVAPGDPGLQFMLGLSQVCQLQPQQKQLQLQQELDGDAPPAAAEVEGGRGISQEQLQSATSHLFAAAAGLLDPGAHALREALQQLVKRQVGVRMVPAAALLGLTPPAAAAAAGSEDIDEMEIAGEEQQQEKGSELVLAFFEVVMRLFEVEGSYEGALAFARAALGACKALEQQQRGRSGFGSSSREEQQHQLVEREGELWSHVFKYACNLQAYDDAYAAAVGNPLPARCLEGVKGLVGLLADEGQLVTLVALPWAGVVTRQGPGGEGHEAMTLVQVGGV